MKVFSFFKGKSIFNKSKPFNPGSIFGQTWGKKKETDKFLVEEEEVQEDRNGNVSVKDATSWNAETHPSGAGPSFLVKDIKYDNATKKLSVTYRDGFTAVYDNIDRGDAWLFTTSDSKGRWAHEHLWNLPYRRG